MKPVRLWFEKSPATHEELKRKLFAATKKVANVFNPWVKPCTLGASQPHSKTWGR